MRSSCFECIKMACNVLNCQKYYHSNTYSITHFDISHQSEPLLLTFRIHLISPSKPMCNQTETTIINTKSMNISIKYANIETIIITNHKFMNWTHINQQYYTLNNIMEFNISPEKHFQHIQLIYHLHLH